MRGSFSPEKQRFFWRPIHGKGFYLLQDWAGFSFCFVLLYRLTREEKRGRGGEYEEKEGGREGGRTAAGVDFRGKWGRGGKAHVCFLVIAKGGVLVEGNSAWNRSRIPFMICVYENTEKTNLEASTKGRVVLELYWVRLWISRKQRLILSLTGVTPPPLTSECYIGSKEW